MKKLMNSVPKLISVFLLICALQLAGCGHGKTGGKSEAPAAQSLEEIINLAKKEGQIVSVGMPDTWANWKDTWKDLEEKYGLKHTDTDMSSAEEIAKFEAEKNNPTADIGDVGVGFAPIAVEKGVTQAYKTSYWDEIPDWAKDDEGHWIVGYQGTMSFLVNKKLVDKVPESWKDLLEGNYRVSVGDVMKAAQAQHAVLAAAMAFGGDEGNIQPGIDFFANLAKQGKLSKADVSLTNIEKGEVEIALLWDFNALGYRERIDRKSYEVVIPKDGSIVSGYATIINRYAPHPNAAKLAREYILSDEGQINLAKGYARPIRSSVKLPDDVQAMLLSQDEYKSAKPIRDFAAWDKTAKRLPELWQQYVLSNLK
ncbi:MAG: extracellular solute-binding protein [Tepidanaerobacteraceae bacterium]|nr:extracellular solute-binding protein [Tepidanaerobacteraceae bacterium]